MDMRNRCIARLPRQKRFMLCALISLCLILAATALAEQTPMPTPVNYETYNSEHEAYEEKVFLGLYYLIDDGDSRAHDALYQVRQTLQNNGYYGNVPPDYSHNFLDQGDMNALQSYWYGVTGQNYPTDKGLTFGAMDLVLKTPEPTLPPHEYSDIPWQQGSDDLPRILDRLYRLGYLEDISHDVYDEDVREAVRGFGENNGMPSYYGGDDGEHVRPITADLQRRLIEEDENRLNPKPEATPTPPVPYPLRRVNLLGVELPMWGMWAIYTALLLIGVLVIIYLFVPSERGRSRKKKNTVRFSVTYNGATQLVETEITKALKIGRGVGNFPLDLADSLVSRRHCELYYINDALMLRDYSSNGTKVNDKPLHNAECKLSSGDVIVIGNHTITVSF